MWQQKRPKHGYLSILRELQIRTSAAKQAGAYSSITWEFSCMIVSSVLTEIKTAAVLNSQGGRRGGESGRERENVTNQESK